MKPTTNAFHRIAAGAAALALVLAWHPAHAGPGGSAGMGSARPTGTAAPPSAVAAPKPPPARPPLTTASVQSASRSLQQMPMPARVPPSATVRLPRDPGGQARRELQLAQALRVNRSNSITLRQPPTPAQTRIGAGYLERSTRIDIIGRTHQTPSGALKTPHIVRQTRLLSANGRPVESSAKPQPTSPTTADIRLARRAAEAALRANGTKPSMSLREAEARVAGDRLTQERYDTARALQKR